MTLIVEDGTGVSDANGYISLNFFQAYHSDRGNSHTATNSQIEQSIIRSTDYIDRRFRFSGYRSSTTQSLEWPRVSSYYRDGRLPAPIPKEIAQATAEYAFRELSFRLAPDPIYNDSNVSISEKTEQVGPIREGTVFNSSGIVSTFRKFPMADKLLTQLTIAGSELLRV